MNSTISIITFIWVCVACSSHYDGNVASEMQGGLGICDSLQLTSRNRSGDTVISTLFNCDPKTNQDVVSYSSKDGMVVAQRFQNNPDSMVCIVHNVNGTVWSRTTYLRGVPSGGVYCTNEDGDTIQYYYHGEHQKGKIAFTALRNVQSHTIQYTGNPIHSISLSTDRARSGDSVWVDIEVCDLHWVSSATRLVESMVNNNERLVHEPVAQHQGHSTFLLTPQAIGSHKYEYEVELIGRYAPARFNRIFTIQVAPR